MKEKVYLDSTIPSYHFGRRESLAVFADITRQWWWEMAGEYELFISGAVCVFRRIVTAHSKPS
uniref:Uncharacterized protein n=1 Tax=Candidatus Kentrum sp. SD TaxID=2126332 RepID=A0A450YVX1_9GAMM|nr:MAG: hypothetical protein BECKSD772F_GA0070984_10563 [Candidatus Kentron sp. SD]VFK45721.1 MAG: hypothetical protein BECKSD772E_GA0070983_10593 [Candidatus Kentron sp. SD]